MIKTAVLLTVYNRCAVTLKGLSSLYKAIENLGNGYTFDVYMTDDGCTDGTSEAVHEKFPNIHIIQGDGSLFWSGGMRKAWQEAINSGKEYDYYLWFNDDAELYEDALITMFDSIWEIGGGGVITGAFCDSEGNVSYGGWDETMCRIAPNGDIQDVALMNGNLVLIHNEVEKKIGIIDIIFTHSLGDWDYGKRVNKNGFRVLLASKYVGKTERHDEDDSECYSNKNGFLKRWKLFHNKKHTPKANFIFDYRYYGIFIAVIRFLRPYVYIAFPRLYKMRH